MLGLPHQLAGEEDLVMNSRPNESITPTPRERELMMLIARGLQNKNIAYELRISENTVRAHIGNIMRKYHLQNRTQIAIIFALRAARPLRRGLAKGSGPHPGPRPSSAPVEAQDSQPGQSGAEKS
jgi:DNA-binding CsgD family transcriptional regulator